jgi:hypothetical protein
MKWRILPLVMVLLFVGISVSADAAVLCSNPSESVFVREQCKANEQQLDPGALGFGLQVIFRDVTRDAFLNPRESLVVVASCQDGEVVIGGGFNFNPENVLRVTLNSAFFDGVHSGWRVDLLNAGDTTALVSVRVGSQCSKGTGVGQ